MTSVPYNTHTRRKILKKNKKKTRWWYIPLFSGFRSIFIKFGAGFPTDADIVQRIKETRTPSTILYNIKWLSFLLYLELCVSVYSRALFFLKRDIIRSPWLLQRYTDDWAPANILVFLFFLKTCIHNRGTSIFLSLFYFFLNYPLVFLWSLLDNNNPGNFSPLKKIYKWEMNIFREWCKQINLPFSPRYKSICYPI